MSLNLSELTELYNELKNYRKDYELKWERNISYSLYDNPDKYGELGGRIVSKPRNKIGDIDIYQNNIYPLLRQALAYLKSALGKLIVNPMSSDSEDMSAAELGSLFLDWRHIVDDEDIKIENDILWCMLCGISIRYTYWDSKLHNGIGDICSKVISPYDCYMSPDCISDTPKYIVIDEICDIKDINERYNVKLSGTKISKNYVGKKRINSINKHSVILHKLYIYDEYGDHKEIIWVDDNILSSNDIKIYPISICSWFPVPDSCYGKDYVSSLLSAQDCNNILLSGLVNVVSHQVRGDMTYRGNPGTINEIEDVETGRKIVVYPPDADLSPMRYDFLTADAYNVQAYNKQYMQDIAGIHDISIGNSSAIKAGTSATQIAALKESNLTGLDFFRNRIDKHRIRIGRIKILLAKMYYKTPRILRVVGDSNAPIIINFFGSDLETAQDISVTTRGYLSPAQIQQAKLDAIQSGLLSYSDPEDELNKRLALQAMDIPGLPDNIVSDTPLSTLYELAKLSRTMRYEIHMQTLSMQLSQLTAQQQVQQQAEQQTSPASSVLSSSIDSEQSVALPSDGLTDKALSPDDLQYNDILDTGDVLPNT